MIKEPNDCRCCFYYGDKPHDTSFVEADDCFWCTLKEIDTRFVDSCNVVAPVGIICNDYTSQDEAALLSKTW